MSATTPSSKMPVFSYAQAAKGLPQATPQVVAKDDGIAQSTNTKQQEESNDSRGSSRPSRSRARADTNDGENDVQAGALTGAEQPTGEKDNTAPKQQSRHRSETSKASMSGATSPSVGAGVGSPREGDIETQRERATSWDQSSRASGPTEKGDGLEKEKIKDSEDDWEKVSVPSVSADRELKAAPPPTVNIWKQRQEAQDAKRRHLETQRVPTQTASATEPKSRSGSDEIKPKSGPRDVQDKNTGPHGRKSTDQERNREGTKSPNHTSRPTSRHGAKSEANVPPPVVDSTSWPTPENSTTDDRRRSNANDKLEKPEKTEGRNNGNKAHSKWVQIPFVPTAKFETPLPPAASKRGGRGGRTREASGRSGHAGQTTERNEQTGNMGPPPVPNKTNEQDRGRKSDNDRAQRANSLPAETRRQSSRESATTNLRKPSAPLKDGSSVHTPISSSKVSSTDPISAKSQTPSRSSSRHEPSVPAPIPLPGSETVAVQTTETSTDVFTGSAFGSNGRPSQFPDRSRTSGSGFRPQSEYAREGRSQKSRDWSRDKSDSVKEKVENWKDRDFSGESGSRRGERSERGRGSYRGRGSHSYSSYQNSHAYTSPLPQNGFEVPKHNAGTPDRSRQTSQPFSYNAAPPSRNNPRSQSIPLGTSYQAYFDTVPGVPQALSPLQTEMPGYNMVGQMPTLTNTMSAMPFNSHLSSYAVLSMVMSQVEYYFSIDNLCKDLFLRKHMDSQGWVPLSVIASFKRIKTLTEDSLTLDILRSVCQQVKTVEYLPPGEDGEDRLRRRDNWQDFVLPMNERLPSAQNDGPQLRQPMMMQPPSMSQFAGESMPFVPQQVRSPPSGMSGMNGLHSPTISSPPPPIPSLDGQVADPHQMTYSPSPHEEVRRGSAVSPLSQEGSGLRSTPQLLRYGGAGGMMNGHQRQPSRSMLDENIFPDEKIAEINICVKDPPPELRAEEDVSLPAVAHVLSNESHKAGAEAASVTIPSRVTGIRGGAANPDQLARLQHVQFGSQSSEVSEPTSFFAKDGRQTSLPPVQPGQYFIPYTIFHENALQDRERGTPGATEPMYTFWETFLVDKFNVGMYEEFKSLAAEDLLQGDETGTQHLLSYYQNALKSPYPMVDRAAGDLVNLLRQEASKARPVFKMMRLAWRDGALDMKTRKRIADHLTDEEKAEFDKGG